MAQKKSPDFQTISLFIILGVLTWGLMLLVQLVLFAPAATLVESATR